MKEALLIIGTWLLSDGIMSWFLYLRAPGYNGQRQTFWRDHWIRLIRIVCAIVIIVIGVLI